MRGATPSPEATGPACRLPLRAFPLAVHSRAGALLRFGTFPRLSPVSFHAEPLRVVPVPRRASSADRPHATEPSAPRMPPVPSTPLDTASLSPLLRVRLTMSRLPLRNASPAAAVSATEPRSEALRKLVATPSKICTAARSSPPRAEPSPHAPRRPTAQSSIWPRCVGPRCALHFRPPPHSAGTLLHASYRLPTSMATALLSPCAAFLAPRA